MKMTLSLFKLNPPRLGGPKAWLLVAALFLLRLGGTTLAQGTPFTYQGRLNEGGSPATGSFDLTFALFNASSGGTQTGTTLTNSAVGVTNGLFTVSVDFGAVFDGTLLWLEIGVRTNGGGSFTTLSPRQQLAPTPYALFAPNAGVAVTAGTATAVAPGSVSCGSIQPGGIMGSNLNLGSVNAVLSGSFWSLSGNAGTGGTAILGTTDNQPLDLVANGVPALRLQWARHATLLSSDTGVNVIGGYSGNYMAPGVVGGTIAGGGHFFFSGILGGGTPSTNAVTGNDGTVGGGYANTAGNSATVPGGYENTASGTASFAAGAYANATNDFSFVWSDGSTLFGSGTNCFDIHAAGGIHVNQSEIYFRTNGDQNHGLGYRSSVAGIGVDGPFLYGWSGGALGGKDPETISLAWDWQGNAWVSNNLSTSTLTIRGGSDVAEPFPVTGRQVEPGTVMVIDPANPGRLMASARAYDTRVAGVISGAGGIKPGLELQQEGILDQGQKVALSGRVFVLAEASQGEIEPGDLLTTSDVPGRAMKALDHARAQGAVLGKAMTGLKGGQGLVLVLVTLQ